MCAFLCNALTVLAKNSELGQLEARCCDPLDPSQWHHLEEIAPMRIPYPKAMLLSLHFLLHRLLTNPC